MNRRNFFQSIAKTIATVAVAQQLVKNWVVDNLAASAPQGLTLAMLEDAMRQLKENKGHGFIEFQHPAFYALPEITEYPW